jgi:hypothetical protein
VGRVLYFMASFDNVEPKVKTTMRDGSREMRRLRPCSSSYSFSSLWLSSPLIVGEE